MVINYIQKFLDHARNVSMFTTSTGLGSNLDPVKNIDINTSIQSLKDTERFALFNNAGIIQRVIETHPLLASLMELSISTQNQIDEFQFRQRLEDLKILRKFVEASISARVFKEAYLVLDIDDDLDYAEPLDLQLCRGITNIYFLEYGTLKPIWNSNNTERIGYKFELTSKNQDPNTNISDQEIIHESRVLCFAGKKLSPKMQHLNGGYHGSILDSLLGAYSTLDVSHNNSASILSRVLTFIYKAKNLIDYLDAGQEAMIRNRLNLAKNSIGSFGGIMVDLETEDIAPMTVPLSGIPEMLNSSNKYFTAQTSLSHDQLWNEGSHSTASDLEDKNTRSAVKFFIQNNWIDNWNLFINVVSKEFTQEQITVTFKFPDLDLTLLEEVEAKSKQADIDGKYVNMGVLTPEMIQANRFSGGNPYDTNLNQSSDIGLQEMRERKQQEEQATQSQIRANSRPPSRTSVRDAAYEDINDIRITTADIKAILEEAKKNNIILYDLLTAESVESDSQV